MSHKEKIIKQLRKGYTIDAVSPKDEFNSVYDKTFKPLINRKDLAFLIELFNTNEPILRAWSFLGINKILQETSLDRDEMKSSVLTIIKEILNDKREISYFGGSCEIQTSLREHHIRRISELDNSIVLEPVMEYCMSFEGETDSVVGELLENVISHSNNSGVETLLLKRANHVPNDDFCIRINIVNAFENLGKIQSLKDKAPILGIFRKFISDIEDNKTETAEHNQAKRSLIVNQKKRLRENIFKVGAVLDLDLEKETLIFIDSLKFPFLGLKDIAIMYKKNKKFKEILLNKLETTSNPNLIIDLLKAIIVIREHVKNWNELVLEYIKKYCLVDSTLIKEMQDAGLLSEKMMLNYLSEGNEWHLSFMREFLINDSEKFEEWPELRNEFINILESFNNDEIFNAKKEFVLKMVLDLERRDLVDRCFLNFKNLKKDNLKKLCLFAIINYGSEKLWTDLKEFLNEHDEEKIFFTKFWKHLKTRDWKYYY